MASGWTTIQKVCLVRNGKNVWGNRSESDLAFLGSTVSAAPDIPPSMPKHWSTTKARYHRIGDQFLSKMKLPRTSLQWFMVVGRIRVTTEHRDLIIIDSHASWWSIVSSDFVTFHLCIVLYIINIRWFLRFLKWGYPPNRIVIIFTNKQSTAWGVPNGWRNRPCLAWVVTARPDAPKEQLVGATVGIPWPGVASTQIMSLALHM